MTIFRLNHARNIIQQPNKIQNHWVEGVESAKVSHGYTDYIKIIIHKSNELKIQHQTDTVAYKINIFVWTCNNAAL